MDPVGETCSEVLIRTCNVSLQLRQWYPFGTTTKVTFTFAWHQLISFDSLVFYYSVFFNKKHVFWEMHLIAFNCCSECIWLLALTLHWLCIGHASTMPSQYIVCDGRCLQLPTTIGCMVPIPVKKSVALIASRTFSEVPRIINPTRGTLRRKNSKSDSHSKNLSIDR